MSDLICRKSMTRCITPGMCSPHGGCQDKPFNPDWDLVEAAQESLREHMQIIAQLKAENEALRATASLSKLLPDLDDALEDLELHGRHSDQGYRKLKDWYRKVKLACAAIDAAMSKGEES